MGIELKIPGLFLLKHCFGGDESTKIDYPILSSVVIPPEVEIVYLFGYSPFVEPLLEWAEGSRARELVILENRLSVLLDWEEEGLTAPFLRENIHFRLWLPEVSLEDFIFSVVCQFPLGRAHFISLHEDGALFARVKAQILRKATLTEAIHVEMVAYHKLFANLIANFRKLPEAFHLGEWKDSFQGVPCVICGAGPSLQEAEELLQREDEILLFAGGSTIAALNAMHIVPHMMFAVDPNPEEFTRLAHHTSTEAPLLISPRVEARVVANHVGPIGFFPMGAGGEIENLLLQRLGIREYNILEHLGEEALSVTCIALMSALYLGCNPIIFAGVDLCFSAGKRYAEGVPAEDQIVEPLLEEEGKMTLTRWIMERDTIEEVLQKYPDRTFYKATQGGLSFRGVSFLHDSTLLNRRPEDLKQRILARVFASKVKVAAAEIENFLQELKESFEKAQALLGQILEELGREKKETVMASLFIMDLEETLAFKLALKTAAYALAYLVQKKQHLEGVEALQELYKNLEKTVVGFLQCF